LTGPKPTIQCPAITAGIAQLVEHNLAKVGVASSNLVSRSKENKDLGRHRAAFFMLKTLSGEKSGENWFDGFLTGYHIPITPLPIAAPAVGQAIRWSIIYL
jgi:hypothetical protein